MISDLGNNKYASRHTITELISSSNLKAYSDEKISDNYKHANKSNVMIPKSYHTNNFEAKMLSSVKDGKTSDELNALKETFVGISQNLFAREDMKALVSGFTSVLDIIDKLTEKLGLFGTVGVIGGFTAFIKNFD